MPDLVQAVKCDLLRMQLTHRLLHGGLRADAFRNQSVNALSKLPPHHRLPCAYPKTIVLGAVGTLQGMDFSLDPQLWRWRAAEGMSLTQLSANAYTLLAYTRAPSQRLHGDFPAVQHDCMHNERPQEFQNVLCWRAIRIERLQVVRECVQGIATSDRKAFTPES